MTLTHIGVVGAGQMGSGIAQVCAAAGFDVLVQYTTEAALGRSRSAIANSLQKLVARGSVDQEKASRTMAQIRYTSEIVAVCSEADLIVEAVYEDLDLKRSVFAALEKHARADAVLASNTSAIPITEISSKLTCKDRVIGLHFMNPVVLMSGVEIIRGEMTSEATFQTCLSFLHALGKEPVVAVDYAGFIVTRLLDVLMNEAVSLVEEGTRPEEIDKAMELCAGHPMGPFKLLDLVGAEIAMHGMEIMARDFGDRYKARPLLKRRVLAGLLGKKTGRGFYDYGT
ncbi:MAG: 3-hydroxyacyl-CoA dehydrogenase family protein [candidate division NC10 bacterium]|nr:3-hydroxyacyl-CoA dehydrogenase family protein [candidate division NC10 bacterium]